MTDPFAPAALGPVPVRNRFIKAATFEGRTPRRVVTPDLIDFHRRFAAAGVGMTTVAYCAVTRAGSTDGHQITLDEPGVGDGLRDLAAAVHGEGAAVSAQIGHAGPVANPMGTKHPAVAPSRVWSPLGFRRVRSLSTGEIEDVIAKFAAGARVLADAGFDAVEIHMGHGYLLSAFLSPRLNRRDDDWGGPLENRARLARLVARAVRDAVGTQMAVTAKLNMDDGVRGGLGPDESIAVAGLLERDGVLDALTLTAGSSFQNPMYLFRGDAPVAEMAAMFPPPLRVGIRLFGGRFFRSYPFEEAYLLPTARRFRAALSLPLVLLGGINRLDTVQAALDEGFAFVQMGRALLREPELLARFRSEPGAEALCVHCNKCMPTIYSRTRCVLVP